MQLLSTYTIFNEAVAEAKIFFEPVKSKKFGKISFELCTFERNYTITIHTTYFTFDLLIVNDFYAPFLPFGENRYFPETRLLGTYTISYFPLISLIHV